MAQTFKPEDYARFLIREFLKKNNFSKTYDSFMAEDTREKVTMTKNQLTSLLGIEALMKRNSKSKTYNTMLDIICDFLMISKEASNGVGVQVPKTTGSIKITESNLASNTASPSKLDRKTDQAPRTQANFYQQPPQSKPAPVMNAFQSGSSTDVTNQQKINFTKNTAQSTEDYGVTSSGFHDSQASALGLG